MVVRLDKKRLKSYSKNVLSGFCVNQNRWLNSTSRSNEWHESLKLRQRPYSRDERKNNVNWLL